MTTLARIKDHVARARAALTSAYDQQPNVLAMLDAMARRVQELEEAAWDVIEARLLIAEQGQTVPWEGGFGADTLVDAQNDALDMLGALVGIERQGRSNPVFATAIRLQLRIARSSGTPDDLIEVGQLSYAGASVVYTDMILAGVGGNVLPATARISIAPSDGTVGANLRRAKPAGVALEVVEQVSPLGLRWGSTTGGVTAGRHTWGTLPFDSTADSRWGVAT